MATKTNELKQYLQQKKIRGLALDIDETLSWTVGFWVEKLQQIFGNPENLSVKELVFKYRYTQNVPYWQTEEALKWMKDHRHSDEIQGMLPLIENSNTIVQKINEIIPIVFYVTTRPETVIGGTQKWLKKHNFPDVKIIAKPLNVDTKDGNKWKARVLEELYPEIVGIIDDNPSLVDHLSKDYKGSIYLYDNIDHIRKDINIIPCKTWEDIFTKVQSY